VHKEWFFKKLSDTQCRIFILESAKDGKIGQVRLEAVPGRGRADINVNLNPAFLGRGWGSMVIEKATRFYLRTHPQIQKVAAEIIMGNEASEKVFRKAGYAYTRSLVKKGRKARIFIYNR
jgi:RimJ/RimL family protein N-acetyltransferase